MKTLHRILLIILFIGCAKQMPPSGGPTDTAPPEIISISPAAGTTNVRLNTSVQIVFSEAVTKKSVEDAIFISPWPSEEMTFKWRGEKLNLTFGDSLKAQKTYVLTVGAQTSDLRNNKMRESFSIAFSTGDIIDTGQISGKVHGSSGVEGMLVCAYQILAGTDPNPAEILADYYTQCSKTGDYTLMYVAPGSYRIFAFGDKDKNRKYTRGVENIGIPNGDVQLTLDNRLVRGVNFKVTAEDTIGPKVKSALALDNSTVALRFSEAIASFQVENPARYFTIASEQDPNDILPIKSCYQNSTEPSHVILTTALQSAIPYELSAQQILDLAGNGLDTAYCSIFFDGKTISDTLQPRLNFKSIDDSSKGVELNTEIRFAFSEAMQRESIESHFHVEDQSREKISGAFEWKNPAEFIFHPAAALKSFTGYLISAPVDSVRDLAGNSLSDSLFSVYFRTLNADTLTAIRGKITDEDEGATGKFHVTAQSEKFSYTIMVDSAGAYRFENILPGVYTIQAFRDADSNGVYSFGKIVPFQPAERFVFYADSVKVRSQWPTEGEDIMFKK
ncbi:MAG: Ig-like domain-containing protein [Candidatus Zhuqueibacterota bacterium]